MAGGQIRTVGPVEGPPKPHLGARLGTPNAVLGHANLLLHLFDLLFGELSVLAVGVEVAAVAPVDGLLHRLDAGPSGADVHDAVVSGAARKGWVGDAPAVGRNVPRVGGVAVSVCSNCEDIVGRSGWVGGCRVPC